ncbi:endolytic transglycosylase MltG [Limobrevibacterium gyesilva]|uniref:Endolytic murein transglycosylase n=1 Tax=Limobrevibacterium gyesilva TaxID=2991712 RepID=A0AA41YMD0_9PROT|nr:endolytic transglycosylase MltG [Limobrevibacterium gyesilva]MCW3473138.1 endolytic transglycosylase MltG [Limobrevibacterium gyesilva]
MTRRRAAAVVLAVVLALGAAGAGGAAIARHRFLAPGPLTQPRNVVVPRGSPADVAQTLHAAGVIADIRAFRIAGLLTRGEGPLRAAEFAFPASASLRQVLTVLRTARPVQHWLTIPEGLTAAQIALLLDRAEAMTGPAPVPDEGALLPESYAYEYGASRAAVVERAAGAMRRTLGQIWAERAEDLPLATPHELLTLASIVERETARAEERPRVAAVFLNRLKRGMKLQSDPTVAYAVSGGMGTIERALTRADLDQANPYNTYRVPGLPPGPIGSPGVAALQAVARPARTDELYFVADGTGGHAFARTLEEHNRNVARWRAMSAPLTH